jgi:hypothetical protein
MSYLKNKILEYTQNEIKKILTISRLSLKTFSNIKKIYHICIINNINIRTTYFEFIKRFSTENAAIDFIAAAKYKDGYVCPKCGCVHRGIYHHVSVKKMQSYIDESCFRLSHRVITTLSTRLSIWQWHSFCSLIMG